MASKVAMVMNTDWVYACNRVVMVFELLHYYLCNQTMPKVMIKVIKSQPSIEGKQPQISTLVYNVICPTLLVRHDKDQLKNKIKGTLILKLAMVKRLKVEKTCRKNSLKNLLKKFVNYEKQLASWKNSKQNISNQHFS